jgi:hypothetical protein
MIRPRGSVVLTASGPALLIICAGAIAQLGERLHGMQEVWGSSPHGSILFPLMAEPWLRLDISQLDAIRL